MFCFFIFNLVTFFIRDPLAVITPMAWDVEMCMEDNTTSVRWFFSLNQFITFCWNYGDLLALYWMWRFARPYNNVRGCMDTEVVVHMVMQFFYSIAVNLKIEQVYKNTCEFCHYIPLIMTLSKHLVGFYATLICYLLTKIEEKNKPVRIRKEKPKKQHLKSILEVDSFRETSNIMSEVIWEEGEDNTDDEQYDEDEN